MPIAPSSLLPLVAYAEKLCVGARVLFVGDARSEVAVRVLERGARLVHVCDEVAARRAEAAQRSTDRALSFGSLSDGSFALREGFFDLALVENLAAFPEPKSVLVQLARLLAPRGAALVAAANPEARRRLLVGEPGERGLDYYALYDAVAAAFPRVRMLGQVPFVGYAVVDFAIEGEPDVVIDASLVPAAGEEPDFFVAVAGEERVPVDAYAVIQLPSGAVLPPVDGAVAVAQPASVTAVSAAPAPLPAPAPAPALVPEPAPLPAGPSEAELAEQRRREAELTEQRRREAELAEQRRREAELAEQRRREAELVEQRRREAELTEQRRREAELTERRRLESWIAELEARAVAADERADAAEAELDELRERHQGLEQSRRAELEALQVEQAARKAELDRQQRQMAELGEQLRAAEAETQRLREQVAELEQRPIAAPEDTESAHELARLEAQLAERGERIRTLEQELREAERTGRELVRRLSRAPSSAGPGSASAERVAELEAERTVLGWALAIARGETGVSAVVPPSPAPGRGLPV